MQPLELSLIAFACVFGSVLLGMLARSRLPAHHLSEETRSAVMMGMGVVATLAGLVLGLMVATAKSSFDAKDAEVKEVSAKLIMLDRTMARYGPETQPSRELLRRYFAHRIAEFWPRSTHRSEHATVMAAAATASTTVPTGFERLEEALTALKPANDQQKELRSRALTLTNELTQARWLIIERATTSAIPKTFLVTLVSWVAILFLSIGLFAPRNATVIASMLVCSLSLASAIFLVLEMDIPFGGLVRISSAPAVHALSLMGR